MEGRKRQRAVCRFNSGTLHQPERARYLPSGDRGRVVQKGGVTHEVATSTTPYQCIK